jgi:hypothetical protein
MSPLVGEIYCFSSYLFVCPSQKFEVPMINRVNGGESKESYKELTDGLGSYGV